MKYSLLLMIYFVACDNSYNSVIAIDKDSSKVNYVQKLDSLKNIHWFYDNDTDKMDGSILYKAVSISTNTDTLSAPYNKGTTLAIIIRNQHKKNDLLLSTNERQFASKYSGNAFIRIDFGNNHKPISFNYTDAVDGRSNTIFPAESKFIIPLLKTYKEITIEVPFYANSRKQFTFKVDSFIWNH